MRTAEYLIWASMNLHHTIFTGDKRIKTVSHSHTILNALKYFDLFHTSIANNDNRLEYMNTTTTKMSCLYKWTRVINCYNKTNVNCISVAYMGRSIVHPSVRSSVHSHALISLTFCVTVLKIRIYTKYSVEMINIAVFGNFIAVWFWLWWLRLIKYI